MIVETNVLRWFQQVADGTTLTEVSELERVTQPGVSRALARLEDEIGTPLLRRSGRRLRMTRAGAAFKRHVDVLLHELDDGLAAISELSSPDTGTVSLAFQRSLGTWLVPQLLASFAETYPHVGFELHQVRDETIKSLAIDSDIDLEITSIRSTDPAIRRKGLLVEPLLLLVAPEHRLADRTSVALSAVETERFVMLREGFALRAIVEALCRTAGFVPDVAFEGDDLPTIEGFVAAGLGVAVAPASRNGMAIASSPAVRYVPLEDRDASREITIAWRDGQRLLPAADAFRRHVIDRVRARSLS